MEQFTFIKKSFLKTVLLVCLPFSLYASEKEGADKKFPPPSTPIHDITFVAFDTETTGFSPGKDRIVEIGAAKFCNGEIVAKRQWLINPGESIPFYATRVHGITDAMLADKPVFKKVYPEFKKFTKGAILIAHNSRFDRDFMKAEIERAGIETPRIPLLDSLKIFRALLPDAPSHSLENLAKHLDIDSGGYHRAVSDSIYIFQILNRLDSQKQKKLRFGNLIKINGDPDYLF